VFDFKNFDWDKKVVEERINWWMLPVYVLLWIGFKSLYILPFAVGFYFFGKGWLGILTSLILFSLIFSLWSYFENASQDSPKS
jgi:hypothetical protein